MKTEGEIDYIVNRLLRCPTHKVDMLWDEVEGIVYCPVCREEECGNLNEPAN